MLSLPVNAKVYFCVQPTDMRKSFDGLMGLVSGVLAEDPLSGHLFVFVNRRRDRVKLLLWEGDGLAIYYKRLEAGTFQLPAATGDSVELDAAELSMLLAGIDLTTVRRRKRYRRAG